MSKQLAQNLRYRVLAARHPDPTQLDTSVTFADVEDAAEWCMHREDMGYRYVSIFDETDKKLVFKGETPIDMGVYAGCVI